MGDYKQLKVWEKAHRLTVKVYKITEAFPDSEKFGLVSQIRRAAASVPTNIAEGSGQLTKVNYIRFLGIARGSAFETGYLLRLSKDLGYITEDYYKELSKENESISMMLSALIRSLKSESD